MSNRSNLTAVPGDAFAIPDRNNPYTNAVEYEDQEDDVIRITERPIEAYFDESGDEIIELSEQEQQPYHEKNVDERLVLTPEAGGLLTAENILADFGIAPVEEEPDPHA